MSKLLLFLVVLYLILALHSPRGVNGSSSSDMMKQNHHHPNALHSPRSVNGSSSSDMMEQHHHPNAKVIFQHYVLALSWPNSYCEIQKTMPDKCLHSDKTNLPQEFTIHGFWPNAKLETCPQIAFDFGSMGTQTKTAATKKWPDLRFSVKQKTTATQSKAFWSHEWRNHGVCSNMHQDPYMDLTMHLFDVVSPSIKAAMNNGFQSGAPVDISAFTTELLHEVKIKPRLKCFEKSVGQQLLYEIQFFADNTGRLIDATENTNCLPLTQVLFP